MARRSSNTATTEVPKEDTVSTAAPEAPASTDTSTEAPEAKAEKPAEAPIDLTAFEAAVDKAVEDTEGRDAATGELSAALIESVNVEFRKLEGAKAKNKARALLNGLLKDTMNKMDPAEMPKARSYMILSDGLSAGSAAKSERTPADPTEAFVQRMVGLKLAVELAQANVPEGVDAGWTTKANELYEASKAKANELFAWATSDAEDKGDEPETTPVVRSAVKLAQGKAAKVGGAVRSGGSGDGVRRDIGKHIESAFADVESGTFLTVAQIRAHRSDEYGDNPPSAGAISARLFPTSGKGTSVPGIVAGQNDAGKKGATKA